MVPALGERAAYLKQRLGDKLIDHKQYIERFGQDMPEIRDWQWSPDKAAKTRLPEP